jgi:hypothetical protein
MLVVPVIPVDPARLWSNEMSLISRYVVIVVVGKIQIIITRTDQCFWTTGTGRKQNQRDAAVGCIVMCDR